MIKTISPPLLRLSLAVLLTSAAGCGFELFEEVNRDPHPPSILNLQYDPMEIRSGDTIRGTFTYVDEGGDVEILEMRDLDGAESLSPTPPPEPAFDDEGNIVVDEDGNIVLEIPSVFFFPGTTGTIEWQLVIETNQAGPHTIKTWLEDSTGSLSEPVFIEVQVSF